MHEAIPGHYVQAEYANAVQPATRRLLRALYGNTPYIEGWAQYATQTMLDEGFLDNSPELRLTFQKEELRVISNAILDIRMQMLNMTDREALDLMRNEAFQEAEDALAGLEVFATAAKSQATAVADSQRALNIALNRYTGGLVTYLDVVTAQQSLLSNQREAAQIQGGQLVASVMLVKAVGGGWDAHSLADISVKPSLKTALQP